MTSLVIPSLGMILVNEKLNSIIINLDKEEI
jgi:hypothetical protein